MTKNRMVTKYFMVTWKDKMRDREARNYYGVQGVRIVRGSQPGGPDYALLRRARIGLGQKSSAL